MEKDPAKVSFCFFKVSINFQKVFSGSKSDEFFLEMVSNFREASQNFLL
jgi:hypothetical protein